jgi:hypothetical protein
MLLISTATSLENVGQKDHERAILLVILTTKDEECEARCIQKPSVSELCNILENLLVIM